MRVVECVGHLARDAGDVADAELVVRCALHSRPERLAFDVRRHEVRHAQCVTRIEERQDVRVLELGEVVDLPEEPLPGGRVLEIHAKGLDGHIAVVLEVAREVDARHGAVAERPFRDVSASEGDLELLDDEVFHAWARKSSSCNVRRRGRPGQCGSQPG